MLCVASRDSIVLRHEFRNIKQTNYMELHISENRSWLVFKHLL